MTKESFFSKISWSVVRFVSQPHDISRILFAAVMLIAFTAIDVYAFDVKKTGNLTATKREGTNCTFNGNLYTSTEGYYNLLDVTRPSNDFSNYDKLYVTTSGLTGGSYRVIININGDDKTNYTATCSTDGKQGLSLTSDFKNGLATLTKDQLKNVTQLRIGGQADIKGVSFTLSDIHLSKTYEPGPDGKITLLPSDFDNTNVTIDGNGNITGATQYGSLYIDLDDNPDVTLIESITVNTTASTEQAPGIFFEFYDASGINMQPAWGLDNAKNVAKDEKYKNYTLSRFGLRIGLDNGQPVYQLNSVVINYSTTKKLTMGVTFNGVEQQRQYCMYIPASAKGKSNVPVVIALHGRYGHIYDANGDLTGEPNLNSIADTEGFIVVYPQGRNASSDKGSGNWTNGFGGSTGWEATGKENDDTEFLKQIVNKIKSDYGTANNNEKITVDPTRFYLCGFSMGGMMTYAMANAVPNIFAAYASTGGYPINEFHLNVADINRLPFLHIHAKDDTTVPYSLLETIKQNMVARYGHEWVKSTRDSYDNYDIYDFKSNTSNVGALRYVELDVTDKQHVGHSVATYAPAMMYDFFKLYSYPDHFSEQKEWSWHMPLTPDEIVNRGWQYGNKDINFGNHSNTGVNGNHNVYPCIQLPAGKHVIYAKYSMAAGEDNAYLTLKNNNTGTEIVARKLVNNSGQGGTSMTIAYEFETGADAEYSVYVGRAKDATSCTDLAIYKAPYTAATDQSVDNTTVDITTGKVLEITFEELKSSVKTDGINPIHLTYKDEDKKVKDNGVDRTQPTTGYDYYYANRLERKNGDHHYDVIHHDAVFGNYFQNMPHADIYERTGEEDFMRIMFPAGTLKTVKDNGAITIGFWVNAKLAVDLGLAYRDPSIFYLAGGSYIGPNSENNPHMFNIKGAGGISGYMSADIQYAGGSTFGDFSPNSDNRGEFYKNNFYLDGNWHYITYQMYKNFSLYNMYVDGFPATLEGHMPTSDTSKLTEGIDGLKSIVLGGLNACNVEFSYDVAFAYDDIVIYDRVLSHADIKKIISDKEYTPSWIFYRTLKNKVMFDASKLSSTLWTDSSNGVYTYNQNNSEFASLTYDGVNQIPAFRGLQFKNSSDQIKIDTNNGKLILSSGVTISFASLPADNSLRFETETDFTYETNDFWSGSLPDINGHTRKVFWRQKDTDPLKLTLTADANIFGIERTEKQYIQLNFVEPGKEAEKLYDPKDIVTTPRTYGVSDTPNDTPTLRVVKNGVNAGNSGYTFKYSSSAPHIASVDIETGKITLHGVQGSAIITAELVDSERNYDTTHGYEALYESSDRIFATYEIITTRENGMYVVNTSNTYTLNKPLTLPGKDDDIVCKADAITVTLGGWKFNSGTYQEQTDSYSNVVALNGVNCYGFDFDELNTETDKFTGLFGSGSSLSTNGAHEAKSEAWNKIDATTGFFTSNEWNTVTDNVTPWTLPCRGSHIKVEPIKPGIVSVYVRQEGCVSRDGKDKPQSIKLNTVFVTDETGKSVRDIVCDTKTRVADQIWKDDGRARAEYYWGYKDNKNLYSITDAICQSFEDKSFGFGQKWSFLDNWENPGMTGHVFCVDHYNDYKGIGLDGHVVISTGIVRYTFNVVPGKSYYIFSNNSALGLAGFTFDEGKHMNLVEVQGKKNAYLIAHNNDPVVSVSMGEDITLADDGKSFSGVTESSETDVPRYDEYTHKSLGGSGLKAYKPGTRAKVTLSRTFKDKQWAGICLPYTISNRQLKAAFGEDTRLVLLHHIDNNNVVFINHTNEDLIAGYPYLIFPNGTVTESGYSTVTSDTDGKKTTIKDIVTYATFEQAKPKFSVMDQQNADFSPTTVAYAEGTEFDPGHHYFIGLFETKELGEGSYYISNTTGKLTRIGKTTEAKPYRSYIKWQPGTTNAKAPMLSTMLVEDSEGNDGGTTSIDDILFDQGIMTQAEDVYTVSGMKIGRMSDMQHLQRGIYIVNGKKFVKK